MIHYDNTEEIQHGIGVGSGRGRPKGSRNGFIDPRAAYMKNYKIVGQVAEEADENLSKPQTPGNAARTTSTTPRQQTGQANQNVQAQTSSRSASPASFVNRGKQFIDSALGKADRAWNGYEIEGPKNNTDLGMIPRDDYKVGQGRNADVYYLEGKDNPTRVKGVKDNIAEGAQKAGQAVAGGLKAAGSAVENAAKDAANAVGNAANAVGREADRIWNGQTTNQGEKEKISGNYEPGAQETHNKGAREAIENTLVDAGDQAKAWWEDLLDWGENAWNGVSNWATSQIDAGKEAYNSAKSWVTDRFNDASSWASTAYKDVSDWIGDRGAELDRWWNGYDEKQTYGSPEKRAERQESHVNGFRENATNWINDRANEASNAVSNAYDTASQWITDRGAELDRWWNGYDEKQTYGSPENRAERQESHVNGARENITNAIGEASDNVVRAVRDAAGNVHQAVVNAAGDIVGWVGERAEDVNKWWNGDQVISGNQNGATNVTGNPGMRDILFNGYAQETQSRGVPAGLTNAYQQGTADGTRIERIPGLVDQGIARFRDTAGNVRDAVVDASGNFIRWADNAGQTIGRAAAEVADTAATAGRNVAAAVSAPSVFGDNFVNMTNSQLAQEANRNGMSMATLNTLASTFLTGDPNSVNRNGFDNILMMYSDGKLNDNDIQRIIENSTRKPQ